MGLFHHRAARAALGAALGFVGVTTTVWTVERFGSEEPGPGDSVGAPDFTAHCAAIDDLIAVNVTGDALGWRCAGFIDNLWITRPIDLDELCIAQYGADAMPNLRDQLSPDGWQCIKAP